MNIRLALIGLTLLCSAVSEATSGWLIVSRGPAAYLVRADGAQTESLAVLHHNSLYTRDDSRVAVLSPGAGTGFSDLYVFQLSTGESTGHWQVPLTPVVQLAGPSNNLVLIEDKLLVVSMPGRDGDTRPPGNSIGGAFLVNVISLIDGSISAIDLPRSCANPRLASFSGTPIVYAWNDSSAWSIDISNHRLHEVISEADVVRSGDHGDPSLSDGKGFSEVVLLPPMGVYRVAGNGTIQRFLDGALASDRKLGASSLKIIPQGQTLKALPATAAGKPAIAVLSGIDRQKSLSLFDASSGEKLRQISVSQDIVPESLFMLDDGSAIYIDEVSQTVNRLLPSGQQQELWSLKRLFNDVSVTSSRAIEVDP